MPLLAKSTSVDLPVAWRHSLANAIDQPYFRDLQRFLAAERTVRTVYPPEDEVFHAFRLTGLEEVKVLLLGQEPYHDDDLAHGLSFSSRPGLPIPPALANIYKELHADLGLSPATHGDLTAWARQGVMLLNSVLTVQAHEANSHKNQGWETFTDEVIRQVNAKTEPVVFVLWGKYAQKKSRLIDASRHALIETAHPSPLSAKSGFFGSRPFSLINRHLAQFGKPPVDWRLPSE